MKFNNKQIYQIAQMAGELNNCDVYIPAKVNFFLQKNRQNIISIAEQIEQARLEIAKHYGILNEEKTQYDIPKEKILEASKELEDLFNIEQDLDIKMIKLEDLGDIQFTPAQMQALMFMIED